MLMRVLGSRRMCSCLVMTLMFPAAGMRQEVLLKLFSVRKQWVLAYRWKSRGRVSEVYNNVEVPYYPDAKVIEKLAIGEAFFYLIPNEDCLVDGGVIDDAVGNNIDMMKTFVLAQVAPNICQ